MSVDLAPVFVALTQRGADLAQQLKGDFSGAEVHGLTHRVNGADRDFSSTTAHLQDLYHERRPIVGICAAGILIRSLAPGLRDKHDEPPVVALAEDGSSSVPLLGGHNGANRLAETLAHTTGGRAAITTASELHFGLALDDLPAGWKISNLANLNSVVGRFLENDELLVSKDVNDDVDLTWLTDIGVKFCEKPNEQAILITEAPSDIFPNTVHIHPATVTIGVGCERGASFKDLLDLVESALKEVGLSANSVACIASTSVKGDEPAIVRLAEHLEVPFRVFSAATLERETPRLPNPSEYVFETVGSHGVSEAAALAAAGPKALLALEKVKGQGVTCAIARSNEIIVPDTKGRTPGVLSIVGIGPGKSEWRAPAATQAISAATDLVGYRLYLDLVDSLAKGKVRHDYLLGDETVRVAKSIALAAEGKNVALVCSGDAGIYAMATLVFECLDAGYSNLEDRFEVNVVPGISALQAAAARSGAPLGHDFCTISLSDLLTPWETIANRLKASGQGDFVIALYNPVSKKRTNQLMLAKEILLKYRPETTPVVLAKNLGRENETIQHVTLGSLESEMADMLTTILIGNSQTRRINGPQARQWVYTPRGYTVMDGV